MERVRGVGGVFFRCENPAALQGWYVEHLGLEPDDDGYIQFRWQDGETPERPGRTIWAPFPADTTYLGSPGAPFMINYRVDNLDRMLDQLRAAGCPVDDRTETSEFGRFGWATDPEGNRFELWEPPIEPVS